MRLVATLGLCVLGAAALGHAAGQDADDTAAPPADAAADPWAGEARAAADADSELKASSRAPRTPSGL